MRLWHDIVHAILLGIHDPKSHVVVTVVVVVGLTPSRNMNTQCSRGALLDSHWHQSASGLGMLVRSGIGGALSGIGR